MAKSKKAAPKKNAKKASPQKPLNKVAAKAKKPAPTKSKAPKAKPKAPAKKITAKAKAKPKAIQPKKALKSKSEDILLHQAFMESLTKLHNFWIKKVALAEKELSTLINKQQKALLAKTPKQIEKAHSFEAEIAAKREEYETTADTAHKFTSLKAKIEQFEAQWSNQVSAQDDNADQEAEQIVYHQETAIKEQFKTPIRHTPKEILEEEWEEGETVEDESDDIDDIFMPQDDLSEFEVIEDFSVTNEDDLYEEDES